MNDILHQIPSDDTGADTLQRFRYQAQIALPFCLDCAFEGKVRSVIMEHFEDIVIEYEDHWHFIQVKSRNTDRGDWPFAETVEALKSLYRAFKETSTLKAKYSLFVEGNLSKKNSLKELTSVNSTLSSTLIAEVTDKLGINESDCRIFLDKVSICPNQKSRSDITNYNIRLMGQKSSNVSHNELESLERKLTNEILKAMRCERLNNLLYEHITQSESLEDSKKSKIMSKIFTIKDMRSLLGSFCHGDYPLLSRINSDNTTNQSNLVKKLIAAGASERIINNAKDLRANAASREFEILASGFLEQDNQLTNVQMRLETLTNSIVARHENLQTPANTIWYEVMNTLMDKDRTKVIDPNYIYKQDPYILLGAVCGLSDECKIDWGVKIA